MSKLVIKNGRVVDPSQNLDRVCDLGIEDGVIEHIGDAIPTTGAEQFDASGLIVAPGHRKIAISLPGYQTFSTEVDLAPKQKFEIKTDLLKSDATQMSEPEK